MMRAGWLDTQRDGSMRERVRAGWLANQGDAELPRLPVARPVAKQLDEGLLALADDCHVDGGVLQHPQVIALHLGPADDHAQLRQPLSDSGHDREAALAVPGVERDAQHVGPGGDDGAGQQRVPGVVDEGA